MKNLWLFILTIALFGCSGSKDDKMPSQDEVLDIKADLKLLDEISYFKENVQLKRTWNLLSNFDILIICSQAQAKPEAIVNKFRIARDKTSKLDKSVTFNYNKILKLLNEIIEGERMNVNFVFQDERTGHAKINTESLSNNLLLNKKLTAKQAQYCANTLKSIVHYFRDTCNFLINDMYNGNFDSYSIKEIQFKTDTLMNYGLEEPLYKSKPNEMHNSIINNYNILSIPSYTYEKGEKKDYITNQFENTSLSNAILLISFYSNRLLELENILLSDYVDYIQNETFKLSNTYEDPTAKP